MDDVDIEIAIETVYKKVHDARQKCVKNSCSEVCVIAVSKKKPKSMILKAYNCGHRHFGENYVNELAEKSSDPEILEMCPEIKWHFIGHLQSNKVNKLLGVPNLYMIHTVDSTKLADAVEKAWSRLSNSESLKVMIQVNTSGEESKSGMSPENVYDLVEHINKKCNHLSLSGLMTIGYANYDLKLGPNPEFQMLADLKCNVCRKFSLDPELIGISMGMSQDFEHAIELGSTHVRVGSSIFGVRNKNEESKVS